MTNEAHNLLKNEIDDDSEVCCRVVHISDLFRRHAFAEATILSHDGLHSQILVSHVLLSLPLCYFCVSLRDYQCRQPQCMQAD